MRAKGGGVAERWLYGAAVMLTACAVLLPMQAAIAGERTGSFDAVREGLDRQLHVRGKGVPLMWAVSLVARGFTGNGVRGLRVVEYEGLPEQTMEDRAALAATVRERLGAGWSPMVRERSEKEMSLVYVQPASEGAVRMIVVDLEGREVNLVRMEMSPEALTRWERNGGH